MTPTAAVAEAVNAGAKVINMSLRWPVCERDSATVGGVPVVPAGGCDADDIGTGDSFELALRAASMLGVVAITSVGNCGDDSNNTRRGITMKRWEWNGCPRHNATAGPAAYPDVISVAAITHDGTRSSFSTANQLVDIAAPGGERPRLGEEILSTGLCMRLGSPISPVVCGTDAQHGTSMAAPFVSGVVAHMLNRHPDASVGQIRVALQDSAEDAGSAGHDREFGYGIVDPDEAAKMLGGLIAGASVTDPVDEFVSVSAGAGHSCGLAANGRVRCWGVSDVVDAPTFAFVSLSSPPEGDYVCGVRSGDGAVQCWGDLPAELTSPVAGARMLVAEGRFAEVAAGGSHVCGRRRADDSVDAGSRGRVVCWGDSSDGKTDAPTAPFGDGDRSHIVFEAIAAGTDHTCGLTDDLRMVCWGALSSVPDRALSHKLRDVAAGGSHGCGVGLVGASLCVGDNDLGQLDDRPGRYGAASAGRAHTCAIAVDGGAVSCWGDNSSGQSDAPAGEFKAVAAGANHTCAVRADGQVVCWGDDRMGQAPQARLESLSLTDSGGMDLLDGVFDPEVTDYVVMAAPGTATLGWVVADDSSSDPQASVSVGDSDSVAAGYQVQLVAGGSVAVTVDALFGHGVSRTYTVTVVSPPRLSALSVRPEGSGPECVPACAELALSPAFDPEVFAYSVAAPEDLARLTVSVLASGGAAAVAPDDADPASGHQVALATNEDFAAVSAGGNFSCGLKTGGAVQCWGENDYDQLSAPTGVFSAVSAGTRHACALGSGAQVSCWGWNLDGQTDAPFGAFTAVSAGGFHTCGLESDDSATCWGYDDDGQASPPAGSFDQVEAGSFHTCGVSTSDRVSCWGWNLLDATIAPSGDFTAVSAGTFFACGIRADATLACWGANDNGQSTPPSGTFSSVSAGVVHACALTSDAIAACWGANTVLQAAASAPSGTFNAVTAGGGHSCGLRATGSIECWGSGAVRLQVAAPTQITLTVTSDADPSLTAVYTVAVSRTAPASAQQSEQAPPDSGAGARSADGVDTAACKGDIRCEMVLSDASGQVSSAPGGQAPDPGTASQQPPAGPAAARSAQDDSNTDGNDPSGSDNSPDGDGTSRDQAWLRGVGSMARTVVCPTSSGDAATVVEIVDGVLRAEIERLLDKTPGESITAAETATLTSVSVPALAGPGERVSSLAGLQHGAGLVSLNLAGHDLSAVQPLSCLTGLTALDLSNNQITDISHLAGLTNLTALDLSNNQITDISHLAGLTGLTTLGLARNGLTGIGALSALTELRALHLYDNQISDVAALAGLTNLTTLYLDHNDIGTITSMSGLTGLVTLGLGDNDIVDVSALSALTSLDALYLFDNDIASIDALGPVIDSGLRILWADGNRLTSAGRVTRLPRFDYLDIRHNELVDVDPLYAIDAVVHALPQRDTPAEIPDTTLAAAVRLQLPVAAGEPVVLGRIAKLRTLTHIGTPGARITSLNGLQHATQLADLRLRDNRVTDTAPLSGLDSLQRLDLQDNGFTNLAQLDGLESLRWLNLTRNNITSLAALPALPSLKELYVSFNETSDITPLAGRSELTHLALDGNQITDIAPLAQLPQLESLQISGNRISDIGALSALSKLSVLRLSTNPVTDHAPLRALTELTELHLYRTGIADLAPLAGLTSLRFLDIRDNQITSLSPLSALAALRTLHVDDNQITDFSPLDAIENLTIHGRDDQNPPN